MKIRFVFHGGFRDGEVVAGVADVPTQVDPVIARLVFLTDNGRLGARFQERGPLRDEFRRSGEFREVLTKMRHLDPLWGSRRDREELARRWEKAAQYSYEVARREEAEGSVVVHLRAVDEDTASGPNEP